jgi:hypothetical protein
MDSFVSKENIDLLWEVLLDDPILKNTPETKQKLVYNSLYKNINIFYNREKSKPFNLITLNKGFLGEMLKMLRNDKSKDIFTEKHKVEDIHAERQILFEKELAEKKNDFEKSITLKKPPIPDFTEKIEYEKIKGMEELIAKTVAQRNFDISQIHPTSASEDWLKPQETSVKPVEFKQIKIEKKMDENIIKNEIIELSKTNSKSNSKKISWSNKDEIQYFDSNSNILNKLKKIELDPLSQLLKDYMILKEKVENIDNRINENTLAISKILQLINDIKYKNNLKI